MAELDVERVQDILNAIGLPRADFIKRMEEEYGVRKDTTRTWFRGARKPRKDAIHQMAALLQVDPNDIIKDGFIDAATEERVETRVAVVPMFDTNTKIVLKEEDDDDAVIKRLRIESRHQHELVATGHLDNYFATRILNGLYGESIPQWSIVTWQYGEESLREGSMVVIYQGFGIVYLRRIRFNGGTIDLYDLRDDEFEDPRPLGASERILGTVVKVEYTPQGLSQVL